MVNPLSFIQSILLKKHGAPPPVAMITSSAKADCCNISFSFSLNPTSPKFANNSGMLIWFFRTTKSSRSIKVLFNLDAKALPILLFPQPIKPIKNIFLKILG